MVCLFPDLEPALGFDREVKAHLLPVRNRIEVFGRQLLMNEEDEVTGEEELLPISATDLPLEDAYALALRYGGAAYPAHIDRDANGIIAIPGRHPAGAGVPRFRAARRGQSHGVYRTVWAGGQAHRLFVRLA